MASQSTYSPEAQCHQSALKTSTADFIKLKKDEDKHNMKHYGLYIADIKFLLDTHIADLATHAPKDVENPDNRDSERSELQVPPSTRVRD